MQLSPLTPKFSKGYDRLKKFSGRDSRWGVKYESKDPDSGRNIRSLH